MDKKILLITGVLGISMIGVIFMLILVINQIKKESLPYCYVDVWSIAENYVVDKALNSNTIKNKRILVSHLTEQIKQLTENPYAYGCKAIFMKGAILSKSKDITEIIRKQLK